MEMDKVLVFDIWGDYGHFRKIETTTSPLTYSIPTITSLNGLIAAIMGLQRDSYYELFSPQTIRYGIKIQAPVKRINININLINTSDGFFLWDIKDTSSSPTPFEFLKSPHYRIYVWLGNEDLYLKLKDSLISHKSVFTPCLGLSELIANFRFIGEFKPEIREGVEDHVDTAIKKDDFKIEVDKIEAGMRLAMESIPFYMDSNRRVLDYKRVLLEQNGRPLKVEEGIIYKVGEDKVAFL
ncbi:type I-B CRISPR-associated protein Cas5b [Methanothermobacter sp.]|uniref:type I-B CRISPR-associated protein Cas5b n=1 Tax=Methanothermobacter sp. TaxID=1884223 RepID=UPI00260661BB|nr:type I-B CRISPR-associated protein Cas5b [Methanothermobacter sp.]MDI9619144.1 type I-B CRISPR-associated protein Cas5b [Methanothermobacter sp.]